MTWSVTLRLGSGPPSSPYGSIAFPKLPCIICGVPALIWPIAQLERIQHAREQHFANKEKSCRGAHVSYRQGQWTAAGKQRKQRLGELRSRPLARLLGGRP